MQNYTIANLKEEKFKTMTTGKVMSQRQLGQTKIFVSPIGLGVMEFGGGGGLLGNAFPIIPQAEKMQSLNLHWMGASIGLTLQSYMAQECLNAPYPMD